jgi:hypothetical protein
MSMSAVMNKPFFVATVTYAQLKKYQRWVKKNRNFGAYLEAEERHGDNWYVKLFCPVIHIDIYGNRAIKPKQIFTF